MTTVNLVNPFLLRAAPVGGSGVSVGAYVSAGLTAGLAPSLPTDTQEGDLLIMRVGSGTIDAATEDAGWQTIVVSSDGLVSLAYIVVGPSLPTASQTLSGTRMIANITRYRLPAAPTLVDFSSGVVSGATATAPSITIPGDATRVLVVAAAHTYGSVADVAPDATFAAADMSASVPDGTHPTPDNELSLPTARWLAEGAASASRSGQTRSMHGFSVTDTSPPAATGAFSKTFAFSSVPSMAAAVFKY